LLSAEEETKELKWEPQMCAAGLASCTRYMPSVGKIRKDLDESPDKCASGKTLDF
jgi:hypothetical protein